MRRHPEGGWFVETWRHEGGDGRGAGTCIYFLLERGQSSHWHRVDAAEIWHWYGGDPLELEV
ncbi:MAG: cupin domain-containing protein, partial [Nannocystaceae bacterium]